MVICCIGHTEYAYGARPKLRPHAWPIVCRQHFMLHPSHRFASRSRCRHPNPRQAGQNSALILRVADDAPEPLATARLSFRTNQATLFAPAANSVVRVLPSITRSARFSDRTKPLSGPMQSETTHSEPARVDIPLTAKISLTAIGTPIGGPRSVPEARSSSIPRAAAHAYSFGFKASMRARYV